VSAFAAQQEGMAESLGRRLAAACLGAMIVLGSAVLWIGLPLAGFWAAGQLTRTGEAFLLFVSGVVPISMVLFGWVLYKLGARYEALRPRPSERDGRSAWLVSLSDERAVVRRHRAGRPLVDVAMTASAVTAIVVMVVWFFLFAHMNLAPLP
jgi:hypothetical protein